MQAEDDVPLVGLTGAVVLREQATGSSHRMMVGHLPAGLYVVQVYGHEEMVKRGEYLVNIMV